MTFRVINYDSFDAYSTNGNNLVDKLEVSTLNLSLVSRGASYYNDVTSGGYTAEFFYIFFPDFICEFDPSQNPGQIYYVESTNKLYQVNELGLLVETDVISSPDDILISSSIAFSVTNVRTQITNLTDQTISGVGVLLNDDFNCEVSGLYSIYLSCTFIAGAILSLEIIDSVSGKHLANSQSVDVSLGCAINFIGKLQPIDTIRFFITQSLAGPNPSDIELNIARLI